MELQGTQHSQSNLEKEQNGKIHSSWFQNNNNQECSINTRMISGLESRVQKQTHTSMVNWLNNVSKTIQWEKNSLFSGSSFRGDKNVQKLTLMKIAPICEYTTIELYTLNGWIMWYVNYIPIKLFKKFGDDVRLFCCFISK